MAGHGGGSKKGVVAQVQNNGCLRYLALYVISLLLILGAIVTGVFQKIPGLSGVASQSAALTVPTAAISAAANPAPANAGTSASAASVGLAPNTGGSLPAGPVINALPLAGAQGASITPYYYPPFYIVRPGDSLDGIAAQYGTTAADLRTFNRLPGTDVQAGQVLYLPPVAYNPVPNTGRNAGHDSGAPAGNGDNSQP